MSCLDHHICPVGLDFNPIFTLFSFLVIIAEIEAVLDECDQISEAAVVGYPHDVKGDCNSRKPVQSTTLHPTTPTPHPLTPLLLD